MTIALFIKDTMSMDADPVGILAQNSPNYTPNATYTPQITAGQGKFNGQGLSCNRAASATFAVGLQRQFQSTGLITNTVTTGAGANAQKSLFGWGGWVRLDSVVQTLAASPLISLTSSGLANTTNLPLFGVLNNTTNGLNFVFPTNYSSFTTSPVLVAAQTGIWYYIYIRVTGAVTSNTLQTTVIVSGANIRDNQPTTLSSNIFTTNTIDRWQEHSSTSAVFTLDDVTVQEVDGTSSLWPAGFSTDVANLPGSANDMPLLTPKRARKMVVNADGSLSEWTPSAAVPNYLAASNGTDYVQASDSGLTDLYKFDPTVTPAMTGIVAVQVTETSDKFLSVQPRLKFTAASPLTDFDVVLKGTRRIVAVQEQGESAAFTPSTLATLEVGNTSL